MPTTPLQVSIKLDILRETLARVGEFEAPAEIRTLTGPAYEYRNRVQLHLDRRKMGYHKLGSNHLLEIDQCPISSPKILETIRTLREMSRARRWPSFIKSVEIFTNETEVQVNVLESDQPVARRFFDWCAEKIPGYVPSALHYATGGHKFRVSHDAFFQVNRFLIDDLTNLVLEGAEGDSAIDLYSGVGLFTVPLAKRFGKVTDNQAEQPCATRATTPNRPVSASMLCRCRRKPIWPATKPRLISWWPIRRGPA